MTSPRPPTASTPRRPELNRLSGRMASGPASPARPKPPRWLKKVGLSTIPPYAYAWGGFWFLIAASCAGYSQGKALVSDRVCAVTPRRFRCVQSTPRLSVTWRLNATSVTGATNTQRRSL